MVQTQPFSSKAKQFLSNAIIGKEVTIQIIKTDRYKRLVSIVLYDDKNINHELLKNGLAWHYVKYSNDKTLQELEDIAQKNKVGLWQDPHALPLWEWCDKRKNNLSHERVLYFFLFLFLACSSNAAQAQTVYTAKVGTKYHKESCHYLKYSKREITLKKALEAGYEPCSVCKPTRVVTNVSESNTGLDSDLVEFKK